MLWQSYETLAPETLPGRNVGRWLKYFGMLDRVEQQVVSGYRWCGGVQSAHCQGQTVQDIFLER